MATLGGPAIPVSVQTGGTAQGGPAIPVAVVTDGRATQGGPAVAVQVVTSGPVQGGPALPVVAAAAGASVSAGPAIRVYVVSGSLGGAAPVNLTPPTISGTVAIGQTLTATTGTWSNSPTSYTYQWNRNGVAIGGATASTYVLTASDPGTTITVTVTATNASGSTSAISAGTGVPSLLGSLVSYWALEEASGARVDAVLTSGNDLADHNTVTQNPGKVNNAGQFTAANSEWLSHGDNASLSTGDIDFTVACWCYFDTVVGGTGKTMMSKFQTGGNNREWLFFYNVTDHAPQNRFTFTVSSNGTATTAIDANSFGPASTSTWYFVVGWHDSVANTLNIQVNNGTVDSSAYAAGVFDSAADFALGALFTTNSLNTLYHMDGRVDEAGFWKRVLTPAERTALYNAGAGRTYPFIGT